MYKLHKYIKTLFLVFGIYIICFSVVCAGVYNGEADVKGIKWKKSGKYIDCENKNSSGKMYFTEGAAATYSFSNLLIACHDSNHKEKSKWVITAISYDSAITGVDIKSEGIERYEHYPKYIVGKNCRYTKDDGWRCNSYSVVENNGLDIYKISNNKSLPEPSLYSEFKIAKDMLNEKEIHATEKISLNISKNLVSTNSQKGVLNKNNINPGIYYSNYDLTFHGYNCTDDCSGHEAGYEWAKDNNIGDVYDCDGKSNSFNEGCMAYVDEKY